jgi:protein-tyrosine phosphatase
MSRAPQSTDRRLLLDGVYNVRDIGGYAVAGGGRVRWRAILRAGSLHGLAPAGRAALLDLGVRTIIDLRRRDEVAAAPNALAGSADLRYRHCSLFDDRLPRAALPPSLVDQYREVLDGRRAALRAILRILARPTALPALIHCTAGKDRTGLVVALLLALAGVPSATIAADYALSADELRGNDFAAVRRWAADQGYGWASNDRFLASPPEVMLAALAHLDARYGGVVAYLMTIGLTPAEIAALRDRLVEPDSAGEE